MSWSTSAIIPVDGIDGVVIQYETIPESQEQLEVAKQAVKAIVNSGKLGKPEYISVSLAGHATDGHAGTSESISASVAVSTEAYYQQALAAKKLQEENQS